MRRLGICLLLLLVTSGVTAEEGEGTDAAVKAVLAAFQTGGDLSALAARDDPDPWIVAEELLRLGKSDAAAAFAKAAVRPDTKTLGDYVASAPKGETGVEILAAASRAIDARKPTAAITALAAAPAERTPVFSIRLDSLRGIALRDVGKLPESADAFLASGKLAAKLGWLARAANSFHRAGHSVYVHSDFRRALDHWQTRLKIEEARGNPEGIARSVGNLGIVNGILGDYPKALVFYERSYRLLREVGNQSKMADVLNNIGVVSVVLGDYPKALGSFQAALVIYQDLEVREREALALGNIGRMHSALGEYGKARSALKASLKISEELEEWCNVAYTLGHLGSVQLELDERIKAKETLERSLALFEKEGNRGGIARTHGRLGDVYISLGVEKKVIEHHEAALEIAEEIDDLSLLMPILGDLAIGELRRGNPEKAIEVARRAVRVMSGLVKGLAEQEGASARDRLVDIFRVGIEAALETENVEDACYFLEAGRAGTLLEFLGGRKSLQAAVVPPDLAREEATAREAENKAVEAFRKALSSGKRKTIGLRRDELHAARMRVTVVIEKIQRQAKAAANIVYPTPLSLASVQGNLRKGEALVLYSLLGERAIALVVTAGKARVLDLGPVSAIEDACGLLKLHSEKENPNAALAKLTKLVFDPLKLGAATTRLLVSPHGVLSYMPFMLLAGDREIAYVPSGTTYDVLIAEREKHGKGILAIGDPDYSLRSSARRLPNLPGSAKEVKAVGDVVYTQKDATETKFPEAVGSRKRWRAIHIACHGLIDPERPMLSSLALTPDDRNDGMLTTLDVFRMKIPADMVVLSACETGRGKVFKAEGVVGFTRAFMFAGAPRVVVSLWKVDDAATRALMVKFYELWKPGRKSTSGALKEAQEYVRSQPKWSHPYFWAAWQLWGLPD